MTTRATAEPKEAESKETVTYESREAIMGCGCRIIMDATTYESEGAHCAVHDTSEVVRVIKTPPVEIEAPPPDPPITRKVDVDDDDDEKPTRSRRGR